MLCFLIFFTINKEWYFQSKYLLAITNDHLALQDHLSQAIIRLQMKPKLSCEFFLLKPTAYYMNI